MASVQHKLNMDIKELPINFVSSAFNQLVKGYKWFVDGIRVKEIEFNDGTIQKSGKIFDDGVIVKNITFGDGSVQSSASGGGGGLSQVVTNNIYEYNFNASSRTNISGQDVLQCVYCGDIGVLDEGVHLFNISLRVGGAFSALQYGRFIIGTGTESSISSIIAQSNGNSVAMFHANSNQAGFEKFISVVRSVEDLTEYKLYVAVNFSLGTLNTNVRVNKFSILA